MLIGTHNSGTGEKSSGFLSYLTIPFARTQSKTILEQYDAGCRLFDLRVKYDNKGNLVLAHGLWKSSKSLSDTIYELSVLKEDCYISIAYEGKLTGAKLDVFLDEVEQYTKYYDGIKITQIAVKKPTWVTIKNINLINTVQDFIVLDGRSWHTYIPIPWLWNKIYTRKHTFSDKYYTYVDFL